MKYIATVNGKSYEVEIERATSSFKSTGYQPVASRPAPAPVKMPAPAPAAAPVPAAAPAPAPAPAARPAPAGAKDVVSPMPGTVLEIKIAPGAAVADGQVIMLIEAMKMEIEVVAPCAGTVEAILAQKGNSVETGAVLVTLK